MTYVHNFIVTGPVEIQPSKLAKHEEELIVQASCTICQYGWLKWSWDFEELMLCCPSCKVGEPVYEPFGHEWFMASFAKVTNWICVSIQSIED